MRDLLAGIWQRLNPAEPTPLYLLSFFAAALCLFVIAFLIGWAF